MKTILVIGNEGSIKDSVNRAVKENGWRINYCTDASFEIKRIIRQLPDLIIADLTSLSSEKAGLLMHLKSSVSFSFVPVLLIDDSKQQANKKVDLKNLFDDGLIYSFSKPFTSKELLTQIKNIIRQTETINPW
ncbi:MAG: hypothetical protein AB1521_09480 [Bacteroidota bacterium]